jgi:hypothetical protein
MHRLVALRVEPMTMAAYRLDGVEVDAEIPDRRFGALLAAAQDGPALRRQAEEKGFDPLLLLRGPGGPDNEPRLRAIVDQIRAGAAGRLAPEDFAARACEWLGARHAYSLSVAIPRGPGDDIVRWVESNQPGFCEYFAAGFVVLARAAGYPARVVAGYRGGTWNEIENYYQVKNSDAHAWAEIYNGDGAWLRVDPTPGGGGVAGREAAAQVAVARRGDRSWSARLDSLRILWYRRVVSFDQRAQVQMVEQVKTLGSETGLAVRAALERTMARIRGWFVRPWDVRRLGRLAGWLVLTAAAGWVVWRLGREVRWQWLTRHPRGAIDPVRREAGRWLRRLDEGDRGTADLPASAAIARRSPGPGGGSAATAVRLELQRLRYGPRETWPEPRGVFRRAREARRAVRAAR